MTRICFELFATKIAKFYNPYTDNTKAHLAHGLQR